MFHLASATMVAYFIGDQDGGYVQNGMSKEGVESDKYKEMSMGKILYKP